MTRESPPKVLNVSAKRAAELERARLGREKRLKAMADALQNSVTTAPKESLVGASGSSRVLPPKGVGVASTEKVIKATPINSALPAMKSSSAASSPSSVDKGKDHLTGEEKVTTVNFTLPSDFMSGNVLDGTNLFPHLEKFLLPSFRERFEGFPIEETGSHVAGLVFMALQALLALRGGTARIKDLMSAAREREKEALDRADVSTNRAEDFSKRLNEALEHLKIVHLDKEDLSRRLAQSLSITAEQREEMDKVKESLTAASKEIENYKSQVEDLEKKVQAAEDEGKSVFSIARLTARAAIMRQHLRGKNPLASAKEELDVYLKDVGAERDLDSDDEKEEEMIGEGPQMPIHANLLNVQVPSAINHVAHNESSYVAMDGVAKSPLSQAESLVYSSKKLENELLMLGQNIKHHEENIKYLKTHINSLADQIIDVQVTLGTPSAPMTEDADFSHKRDEQATVEHEKSASGIVSQMKYLGTQADPTSSTNNVLGVVATLGKVSDDNLSRLLSEYLGIDTMLALVCVTNDGVEALETYDKSSRFHGLGASVGRTIDSVICLENLRPYVGEFMPDDPQRRLALLKPKFPNGESPAGFLGFAVNMIHCDNAHVNTLTSDGHGIRETLFYTLFSKLQVYRTRAHMLQALSFISDGAISLDGAIIRRNGVFAFGNREEMDVKFAARPYPPEKLVETEKQMKKLKQKKETTMEDLQREEAILAHIKYNFEVKKQEFVRFMAQSSPYAMQYPIQAATPRRPTPR